MAAMTTATVSAAAMTLYKKRAQTFLRSRLYFNKMGTMETIGRNQGQTLSTFRVDNLAAQTSPIGEGTAPAEVSLTTTTFSALVLQYGAFVKITDLLEVTGRSSIMDIASKQLGYNAALTLDTLTYAEFLAGATAYYAGNTTAGTIGAGNVLTATDLRRLTAKLLASNVNPGEDDLFNTVIHPNVAFDFQSDTQVGGYLDLNRRIPSENVWKNELGRIAGHRLLQSSQVGTATVNGVLCYKNITAGPDSLLNIDVDGLPFNLFVNPANNINISNPLGQIGSVGWKATYVAKFIGTDGPRAYTTYAPSSL